ncbi:MAG: FAD-binding oxidoreductase [Acidobacteria bacterium]|nr:FAD-binding oxidoreductase [Acidobacteriota bacterium]
MSVRDLAALLPAGGVSTDPEDLRAHARDWWALSLLRERRGDPIQLPLAVLRPRSTGEVSAILGWARQTRTAVVPFGGGSGVCGAATASAGCVSLDLRGLDRILEIDDVGLTVRTQAGVMGPALEEALRARGLTLGHFPQSIDISTVGGWLAARGTGQKSLRYGRIEDLLLGLEVVLAGGEVVRTPAHPGTAVGPNLARLFVGAEGTLGVITEATLRLSPAPERVAHAAYSMESFGAGLEALRLVSRAGLRPAVARLYDEADAAIALRHEADRPPGAILVLRFEGGVLAEAEERAVREVVERAGASECDSGLAERWWTHRNDAVEGYLAVLRGEMLGPTAVVDTMEVAAGWRDLPGLYRAVGEALRASADHVGCHASHIYAQASCLYFTFLILGAADDVVAEARYRSAWSDGMEAVLASGGTISHHHGVGLLKAPWAARELGGSMEILRAIKRALDPEGVMNPGKLGL